MLQISQIEEEINKDWKDKSDRLLAVATEKHNRALQAVVEEKQELETKVKQLENKVCYRLKSHIVLSLVYTEFILVWLWRKLLCYRNTLESVPGTNQYWQGLNPCGKWSLDYKSDVLTTRPRRHSIVFRFSDITPVLLKLENHNLILAGVYIMTNRPFNTEL